MKNRVSLYSKRFFVCIIALCLLFNNPFVLFSGSAAIIYNPDAALAYAEAHWSEISDCASFASACLYAGGITAVKSGNSYISSSTALWNKLTEVGVPLPAAGDTLTYYTSGSYNYMYLSSNSSLLAAGDPIFYYCPVQNAYMHVAICAGADSNGRVVAYAHNGPQNANEPLPMNRTCWGCAENKITTYYTYYARRIPASTGQINIVFKKNNVNWPDPTGGNLAYVVNTATNTRYNLTKDSSATYKYSTANTLPYGTYKVYLPTGNGNATAYHSTVTLNSANTSTSLEANYYTVTFSGNGGTGSVPAPIIRLKGQTATLPGQGSLVRDNYTYIGWVTAGPPYISYAVGEVYTVNSSIILYAQWVPHVTAYVNIKLNGAAWSGGGNSMELHSTSDGSIYDLHFDASYGSRYYTDGSIPQDTYDIYVESDGSSGLVKTGTFTLSQTNITATVNYYKVQFSGEGYDDGDEPADRICAANASMSVPDQGNLTKVGHSFCYWVSSLTNSIVTPNTTHTITGQQVLRAYWVEGNYRLGDVDHDGALTTTDSRLILQYYNNKITAADLDVSLADYDQDGAVTSTDSRMVLQAYTGKALANNDQLLLNSAGKPITWDDLDWSLLDWDAIDWDNFSFADLIEMLTAGNRNPDHEIM